MNLRILGITLLLTVGLAGSLMLIDVPPSSVASAVQSAPDLLQEPPKPRPFGYFNQDLARKLAAEVLEAPYESLKKLHRPVPNPGPSDWLYQHPEHNFTFEQYKHWQPVRPEGERKIIYLQPIGLFSPAQQQILDQTSVFMGHFFGVPVVVKPSLPARVIPPSASREREWGTQFLSTWILDRLLKPEVNDTTLALVALTATDLWPGEGWNFVFGQASLGDRIGVWSFARNGDPAAGEAAFRLCLRRTLKTAVHETGHILSLKHCLAFACVMNGSNNLPEADGQPLALCPICLRKLTWNTGVAPEARYEKLSAFCHAVGLTEEGDFYQLSLETLPR